MNQDVCLPCVVEELVSQSFASMRAGHKPRDIDQLDGSEPNAVDAERMDGVILNTKFPANAIRAYKRDSHVRVYGRKGVVRGGHGKLCRGVKKSGLADVCLSDKPDNHYSALGCAYPELMSFKPFLYK
jgi:hypothetical protein